MSTINAHFDVANASRNYPLDDTASAISTSGQRLPSNIIVDLNLRYPITLGKVSFIAAVTVSPFLVSVAIQCATDLTDTTSFVPLAVFSAPISQVTPYRQNALQAQNGGVGGWITFGEGITGSQFTGLFAGPPAGLIAPRAARTYQPLPITDIGALFAASGLSGDVDLTASAPVAISYQQLEIDGVLVNAAVLGLVETAALTNTTQSVLAQFIGPCGNRPESQDCGPWNPIESINAVPPDCNGNITIEFRGCAQISSVAQECGIMVDCALGLIDACPADVLPAPDGTLPNDYTDLCISETSETIPPASETHGGDGNSLVISESETIPPGGELPYSETFDTQTAPNWVVVSGGWTYNSDDSPYEPAQAAVPTRASLSTEALVSLSQKNLILWEGFDFSTVPRVYTFDMKLVSTSPVHNGGLVLNYRPSSSLSGQYVYYLVGIDYEAQTFSIQFFNGTTLIPTPAFASLTNLALNQWYEIQVTTQDVGGGNVQITATLTARVEGEYFGAGYLDNLYVDQDYFGGTSKGPALSVTLTLVTSQYLPSSGWVGFYTSRAYARFSYFVDKLGP